MPVLDTKLDRVDCYRLYSSDVSWLFCVV